LHPIWRTPIDAEEAADTEPSLGSSDRTKDQGKDGDLSTLCRLNSMASKIMGTPSHPSAVLANSTLTKPAGPAALAATSSKTMASQVMGDHAGLMEQVGNQDRRRAGLMKKQRTGEADWRRRHVFSLSVCSGVERSTLRQLSIPREPRGPSAISRNAACKLKQFTVSQPVSKKAIRNDRAIMLAAVVL
jgi:hypothetical protein